MKLSGDGFSRPGIEGIREQKRHSGEDNKWDSEEEQNLRTNINLSASPQTTG